LEKGVEMTENITITQEDPEKGVKWILDAKEVKRSDNQATYSGTDFHIKLKHGDRANIELKGDKVDYNRSSGEITLRGNVNGQTEDGYKFVTDHLLYREDKGSIETDALVKLFGPLFSTSGKGLKYNLDEGVLRILADVTTHVDQNRLE
jgi:LPS export ABC transporter protein LptC